MDASAQSTFAVRIVAVAAWCLAASIARPQSIPGVPEPGLILYGQVRNTGSGGSLLTSGTLRWTIQPPSGPPITVGVTLTNINDQFSYVLRVPFETVLAGFTLSSGALTLPSSPASYTRSPIFSATSGGAQQPATIISPALGSFTFGAADRGRVERVDLQVSLVLLDSDGDGLDDNWERSYFGNLAQDGNADPDGDGMKNSNEHKAGTNPNDPKSRFAFLNVRPDAAGGIFIQWSSVALTKYAIERSSEITRGFTSIVSNLDATPDINSFRDTTAIGVGPYFYRIRVQ